VREALLLGSRIGLMDHGQLVLLETPTTFIASNDERALAYIDTLSLPASVSGEGN
jgi:ABC-type proline/glycine betaine transport system ATPase subunit